MPWWHASTLSCIAQHIEHMSLGHAQPMQYWSQVPSPVVLMPVVIVVVIEVVMVALASLAPEVEVDSSALALLVASLLDDALLDSPAPLLDGSLLAVSPSLVAFVLALVVIVVPTVADVPNVGSSRMSVEHATNASAAAMPSRDDVPTISRASQTSSGLDLEIPRVEERSQ